MRLMLEREVAEILRCSTEKVKRLRLSGKLAYQPGRPVLIDEADLLAYLDGAKVRGSRPEPDGWDISRTTTEDAQAWALKQMLKPPRKKRRTK